MARNVSDITEVHDLGKLADTLLSNVMGMADGVSGIFWILDHNQQFRAIATKGRTSSAVPIDPGDVFHRYEEISRGTPFFEQRDGKVLLDSFFLPVLYHDMILGLIHMKLKTPAGRQLADMDMQGIKIVTEDFSPFLHNALTLDRIRSNPLRDLDSDTYNEAFILDFLHRQITMSGRYGRRLGLVNMEFAGAETFQKEQSYRLTQGLLRDIAETLKGLLRDYDIISHVGNFRFLLGLPDTDNLGCRITVERIRNGFEKLEYLGERFERYGLTPHYGIACFPEDGEEVDALLMKSLEKAKFSRQDPFNSFDWGPMKFWEMVEMATGDSWKTDFSEITDTRYIDFQSSFSYLLQEAIASNIVLNPVRRGLLYIGTNNLYITEALLQKNTEISEVSTKICVLGDLTGLQSLKEFNINTVSIPKELCESFQFILLLTDLNAYGLLGVHNKGDEWKGIHTSHDKLVERFVFKLREEYSLQDQI